MNQTRLFFGTFLVSAAALSWACSDDDPATSGTTTPDAGGTDPAATTNDAGATGLACGDSTGAPARALAVLGSYGPRASGKNELAAVNLATGTVDGRYAYEGAFAVLAAAGTEPYLLDETKDTVTRFDALEPWKPIATWDVRGTDGVDGGEPTANPVSLVTPSCNKAYVLRYNRNAIAVIDQSQAAGGTATKYIDLSSLAEESDGDHAVEATAAVYVAAKRRVYVLLGNLDHTLISNAGTGCPTGTLAPSLVAIDVDTDAIVSLGGTAPGGGIALAGYSPIAGSSLIYDPVGDRVLALNGGCGSPTERRGVDEISLATGTAKTLLSLGDADFPSTFAFLDANHAAIAFYSAGRLWDPTQATLGASIPQGIDIVATDGRGGFVATHNTTFSDGGPEVDVVTFPGDGGAEVLVTSNPFTVNGDYVSGLAPWPHH